MPYAKINPTGCGVHKGNCKIRLDFFLEPTDPRYYDKYLYLLDWTNTPFHSHFIYLPSTFTQGDIKAQIDLHLPNFYQAFQDRWDEVPSGMRHGWDVKTRKRPSNWIKTDTTGQYKQRVRDCQSAIDALTEFQYKPTIRGGETFPATEIDMGGAATDRAANIGINGYTLLCLDNPANDTGTIDQFEIWLATSSENTKVGTFSGAGTDYTNRDGETIGSVTSGSKQTFSGLDCDVSSGDFVGLYATSGSIENDTSGGQGIYYISGDQFGTGEQTYGQLDSDGVFSLYGTGTVGVGHYTRSGTALLGLVGAGTRPVICVRSDTALLGLFAGGGMYEYYNEGDVAGSCIHEDDWRAQTFTPSIAHQITSVKLKLARVGLPGTLTVGIRATDGEGKPTGADLCSGTTDADTLTTAGAGEWREITFSPGYGLTASTKYAIVIRALAGDSSNYVSWRGDNTSPTYANGSQAASVDAGSVWTLFTTTDMMFEEWGTLTSRTTALLRTDTLSLGLKATASRILTPIRAQTALLGLKATASEAVDYAAKTGTALLGLLATSSRTIALSRSKIALLGLKAVGVMSTLGHYTKECIVYLGLAVTGTRPIVLTRTDTALLGLKAIATRVIVLTRADTALLGLKAVGNLIIPYIRTGTVYLGLKITASRSFALTRLGTALLGLKAVATRSLVLTRAKTALLGLKVIGKLPTVGRALKLIIVTTQKRQVNVITSLYRKIKVLTE